MQNKTAEITSSIASAEPKLGYVCFFNTERHELYAKSLWDAKQKAIAFFKPKRKDEHMVSVLLAEKDGKPVTHVADF
jgi:hypothetical protein